MHSMTLSPGKLSLSGRLTQKTRKDPEAGRMRVEAQKRLDTRGRLHIDVSPHSVPKNACARAEVRAGHVDRGWSTHRQARTTTTTTTMYTDTQDTVVSDQRIFTFQPHGRKSRALQISHAMVIHHLGAMS